MSDHFVADEKVEESPDAGGVRAKDHNDWWRVSWVSSRAISVSVAIAAR
ncbi:hypothetical protein [Klebsiella pneumoniae IS22]|nr:hypothetical protein [Klebsiella pneumoniae IS22]